MTDPDPTDWDAYYARPYKTASVTRRFTQRRLLRAFARCADPVQGATIFELGGANSCFYDAIVARLQPREYHVIDTNATGLARFAERTDGTDGIGIHQRDVLALTPDDPELGRRADVVYSVGLIEHFDPDGTRAAVQAHFALCRPGGLVLITFPTPTLSYRVIRGIAERLGMWIFTDERPLRFDEVLDAGSPHALVQRQLIWEIGLSQGLLAWRIPD